MQVLANQLVDGFVGVGDMAIELRLQNAVGSETERPRLGVSRLTFDAVEVDGPAIEPARRAGLEARKLEAK